MTAYDQANRIGGTNYREVVEHLHQLEKLVDRRNSSYRHWATDHIFRRRVARVHEILTVIRKAQAVQPHPTTITTTVVTGTPVFNSSTGEFITYAEVANPKRVRVNPDRWELE